MNCNNNRGLTPLARKNYNEDFYIRLRLGTEGNHKPFPDGDFMVVFTSTGGGRYTCGRENGALTNCKVNTDGTATCFIQGGNLEVGTLKAEVRIMQEDPNFPSGKRRDVLFPDGVIELVTGASSFDDVQMEVAMNYAVVSAYELAVKKGYQGTQEEFYATFSELTKTMNSTKETAKGLQDKLEDVTAKWQELNTSITDKLSTIKDGKSAYELAKEHGFVGTAEEWLASLKGERGNTYNATAKHAINYVQFVDAAQAVPIQDRFVGQVITAQVGNDWQLKQFVGMSPKNESEWSSLENWRDIGGEMVTEEKPLSLTCGKLDIDTGSSFRRYKLAPKNFFFEKKSIVTKIIFATNKIFPEDKKIEVFEYKRGDNNVVASYSLTIETGKNYIECNIPIGEGNVLMVQNKDFVDVNGNTVFLVGTNSSLPMFGIDIFGRWAERDSYGGAYDLEYKEVITYNAKNYADKTAKNAFEDAKTYVNERTSMESDAIKRYIEENVFKGNIKTRQFGYDYLGGAFNRKLQILSAGDQKPFNVDVRVTKLIFRDEIANIVNADKEIKVYDCRFGVNDKIEYTATLKANTNYAVCDFTLRNGSVVMVQDIELSESIYLITTIYEAKGYCIDKFNRWVATPAHSSRFSFEYRIRQSKLDEILNGEGNVTSYANTDFVMVFGSSLTDHSCSMRGHSWCEKVNDIVDIPVSNHALSGSTLSGNMGMLLAVVDTLRPSYVWWNNEANGTKFGKDALPHLKAAKEICDSVNAKMILGGENGTAVGRINLKDIDKTYEQFAKNNGLIHSELRREIPNVGATYKGFDSGVHQGYRNQACFFKHVDAFNSLRIMKSVKIFIVRPKSADKDIHELCYDDSYQRLLNFRAASSGTRTSKTSGQIDNLDDARFVVDGGTNNGTKSYEVDQVVTGGSVTCFKKAVVEVITDTIGVTSGTFVVGCDIRPTGVYVARVRSASTSYDGDVRSRWEGVGFEYEDNNIIVELGRKNADIQLYDKIRFIVVCEGTFNLSKPIFKDYDGSPKFIAKSYEQRQYGTELNDNVLMADGWTLSGASIETAPNALGLYKAGTSHIKLGSKGDNATKSIAIPKGTRRVAIRIVAQRFLPIATKRFEGNAEVQNSGYVTSTPAIEAYDNDTSLMGVLINDAAYSERLVHQGWYTDYILYDTDITDEILKIELSKISDDTTPMFVYSVSVQKLE